jgi:hypothetical protein
MASRQLAIRRWRPRAARMSIQEEVVRRPATTAALLLVFACGLGLGAFGHLVMAGDHRATEISRAVHSAESRAGRDWFRHQLEVNRGILSAEEAQLRSDGIIKGLLIAAVLFLTVLAAMAALWFAVASRQEAADGPT